MCDQEDKSLDIVCILLSLAAKSLDIDFDSGPFSVANYQGHVFSVSVNKGKGTVQSGSASSLTKIEYSTELTSPGSDNETIEKYHEALKSHVEEVLDIKITDLSLSWGIQNNKIYLLSIQNSEFQCNCQIPQISQQLPMIALFYAQELAVNVISGECITRGQGCCGFSQTIVYSKVVHYHIFQVVSSLGLDASQSQSALNYLKRRMNFLSPALMMVFVPVCSNCFKLFTTEVKFKQSRPTTSLTKTRSSYSTRPHTASSNRGRAPPIVRPQEPAKIGSVTPSGLIITSDIALRSFNVAKQMYKSVPFPARCPIPPLQSKKKMVNTS